MAKSIRILQLGDVHLPEWQSVETPIDDKDDEFSEGIKAELVNQPLRSILKRINDLASSNTIDAAVCVGDFTTRGETEYISQAIEILHHLMSDHYSERTPAKFAVPGNHDVNRVDAREHGPTGKFEPLESALSNFGWPAPPIEDCVRYKIEAVDGTSMPIHLLNSSIGSWSTHLLPSPIAAAVDEGEIEKEPICLSQDEDLGGLSVGVPKAQEYATRAEQVYHQMDTPYFPVLALQTLKGFMDESKDDSVLVVAHHNLLPQSTPRITHYSELLNSGQVRKFFQSSGKTIIYLHGHIHDDPVEKVSRVQVHNKQENESEIISISAPPIWKGFNEICLFYDDEDEIFLIRVTEYRPDDFGTVGNFSDQKSRYIPVKGRIEQLVTPQVQRVWGSIRDKRTLSWREIVEVSKKQALGEDAIEHALLSLFCCSLIRIGHLGRERTRWRISVNEAVS
ncbi:hypothetical protein GS610_06690 [Ruegeria sp. HKCCD6228]|uniref:metallophosphoesterase family protein n=1 Tax=Ruegeria sp. HKCCD6228 TaxID=2683001 RepID=UPI0014928247|nr:metallophosphoesterase [Ruegeria sp. HKCCD6228]NOD96893.1 hypothetical protein [Ruegeria sp. HKCCD6228]